MKSELSGIYKLLFNSSVKFLLLGVFLLYYGVGLHVGLLGLPIVIAGVLVFGTAIGLLITPLGMLYKDIAKVINMGLGFVMYITPVVYAVPKEGLMKTIMELNPLTPLVMTVKDVAFGVTPVYLNVFIWLMIISIPVFLISLVLYRISIPIIVERLSA